jgi:YidC/Oxa1 family membrane protein insertase
MNNNSDNNQNYIVAIILSLVVIIAFQYFFVRPQEEYYRQQQAAKVAQSQATVPAQTQAPVPAKAADTLRPRMDVINDTPRINIVTPELTGSINLKGALIDDLSLVHYHEGLDPASPKITLLSPAGSAAPHNAYYAEFGWLSDTSSVATPTDETQWKAEGGQLSSGHSLKLTWANGAGLSFERLIAIDDHYMFTITDRVSNKGAAAVTLIPFGLVTRQGMPAAPVSSVMHEGPIGVLDGTLKEYKYAKLQKEEKQTVPSIGGWLGITDKYWLVAMVPSKDDKITGNFSYNPAANDAEPGHFQTDFSGASITVPPGGTAEHTEHLFAGAKKLAVLEAYEDHLDIPKFSYAIDFGWFWFLTKPFLHLLDILGHQLGSFGLAILVFTVMLKGVTLPLSLKAYHGMAKMKAIQPEMARLKERFSSDQPRFQQEMMALYKREKVNPVGGCLPTLIQIPIFFALYKVLYVSIELRQAPFYGWISDMSAPDPTSLFTLFGYIPWNPPTMLHIGIWPVLMGISMYLQQKLSPQPPDPTQARMFTVLPIIFTYMMAQFPAGLVIYWTWSNLLGIAQQWYIMWHDAKMKARAA